MILRRSLVSATISSEIVHDDRGIALSVRESNPARRLYERHGFVVVDTITNRVGGRSFVMQVDLR